MATGQTFENVRGLKIEFEFVVGTEAADVINVGVQLEDRENQGNLGERVAFDWYLSDDAAGDSIAGTAPDGGLAIGTDGLLLEHTANLSGMATTEVDGHLDIDVGETGIDTWFLVCVAPDGQLYVSPAITFA